MNHRLPPFCCGTLLKFLLLLGGTGTGPLGAEDLSEVPPPLRLRRIFVPLDQIDQWPRGDEKYLPIDQVEFQRLLDVIDAKSDSPAGAESRIERAIYRARFDGENLIRGVALLDIKHSAEHTVILPLTGIGLPVSNPRWIGEQTSTAQVGSVDDEQLVALVGRSGRLRFDWTLKGNRDASDIITHRLIPPNIAGKQYLAILYNSHQQS